MKIGNLVIDPPVIIAPMAGVTDYPFRQMLKKRGCQLLFTEMVSARGLVYGSNNTRDLLDYSERGNYTGTQIFGSQPEEMAEAAKYIADNYSFDVIDINMGCPTPKIVKNGSGVALMREPEKAGEIIKAVVKSVNVPVTVKMRTGWNKDEINVVEMAKIVEENGGKALTIHGRTRAQFYKGKADWEIIKRVVSEVDIPVIGNGDIFSPEKAWSRYKSVNCAGIMLARGIRGNPWLLKRINHFFVHGKLLPEPDYNIIIDTAIEHLKQAVKYFGEEKAVPRMRKHLTWYIKGLPYATVRKEKINNLKKFKDVKKVLVKYKEFLCTIQ